MARQGELLGAAAVDRLTSLRRTAARRAEAETLHRRTGEALAALPAPRRTQRVPRRRAQGAETVESSGARKGRVPAPVPVPVLASSA